MSDFDAKLKDALAASLMGRNGSRRLSPSGAGGCPRALYFGLIGMPRTNEHPYEQAIVFGRGDALESIMQPHVEGMEGYNVHHRGDCSQCGDRAGMHVDVDAGNGLVMPGHMDMVETAPGLVVGDYKSTGPKSFNRKIQHGPAESNVLQVQLYIDGLVKWAENARSEQEGYAQPHPDWPEELVRKLLDGEVPSGRLVYMCADSGRILTFEFPYDQDAAAGVYSEFHYVLQCANEFWAASERLKEHSKAWVAKAMLHAPGCASSSPKRFPSSYIKNGKQFTCVYFQHGCGGSYKNKELPESSKAEPVGLPEKWKDVAERLEAAQAIERAARKEAEKLKEQVRAEYGHGDGIYGEVGEFLLGTVKCTRAGGLDPEKIPADIRAVAMKKDTTYYKVTCKRKA